MICPNCGSNQKPADVCTRCGIIFNKFRRRVSAQSGKRFQLKKSSRTLFLFIGLFLCLGGIALIGLKNVVRVPIAAILGGSVLVALSLCIVALSKKLDAYFVELSDEGIHTSEKRFIAWSDIESVTGGQFTRYGILLQKWVEVRYYDKSSQEVRSISFSSVLDGFKTLSEEIQERVSSQEGRVTTYSDRPKVKPEYLGIGAMMCLLCGFGLLLMCLFPGDRDLPILAHSVVGIVIALILLSAGVVLYFKARKYFSDSG